MPDNDLINAFNDMRPYNDGEISAAMDRIVKDEQFSVMAEYAYPDLTLEEVRNKVSDIRDVNQFQSTIMKAGADRCIANTIDKFTYSGLENVEHGKAYLFVSNHRDIVLDALLLQYILYNNNYPTTQVTFGANLMSSQLLVDIGKSNRMFKVERGGATQREFYEHSMQLSAYIRHVITERHESVWIAQRNGRTKNGIDRTNPAIIRMFGMSKAKPRIDSIAELNILPVSVSYQWEPCDILKTIELYKSLDAPYQKKPGEDLNSILTGILSPKGNFHLHFGKPLTADDLEQLEGQSVSAFNKSIAYLLDKQICVNYRLMPTNYIAADIKNANSKFASEYTPDEKEAFTEHMKLLEQYKDADTEILREIFLGIYANPVISKQKFSAY